MSIQVILTGDNSKTLLNTALNETYHSTKGAVTEALHVFIKNGLMVCKKNSINILEMGFGTGLNALCTALSFPEGVTIHYTSIEAFPLKNELCRELAFNHFFSHPEAQLLNEQIVAAPWETKTVIKEGFELLKTKISYEEFEPEKQFDIFYYDAFGPKIQPELWNLTSMQKAHHLLCNNGIFVTYCAQGQFKRNLKAAGFEVECLAGPPGKREMTRGIKNNPL